MKKPKEYQGGDAPLFCIDCGNSGHSDACPKCGSRRHRAWLKPEEIEAHRLQRHPKE